MSRPPKGPETGPVTQGGASPRLWIGMGLVSVAAVLFLVGAFMLTRSHESGESSQKVIEEDRGREAEERASNPASIIERPRVALIAPLSGHFAEDGEMIRRGVELAWENFQAESAGAELMVLDGGQDRERTIRMALDLARQPDILAVIAHLPITLLLEIIPTYRQLAVPLVVPANSHESLVGLRWVFPLTLSDFTEGARFASLIRQWSDGRAVAVIYEPGPYGEMLFEGFKKEAMKQRLHFEAVAWEPESPGGREAVAEIAHRNFPVVWLAGPPLWGAKAAEILEKHGAKGAFFVPRTYGETYIEDLFGPFISKLRILWPVLVDHPPNPAMKTFCKEFQEKYWRDPNRLAALGYDAASWVVQVLKHPPCSRKKLERHFLKHDSPENAYRGVTGPMFFDKDGHFQRSSYLTVYEEGKFVPAPE